MMIRQETASDFDEIYNVVKTAFAAAEHCDGNEQDLVNALRKGSAYIPELSLVAEIDGRIAGYIMFSKASVGEEPIVVAAPLAVLPGFQNMGVGSSLLCEGHRIAKELGYRYASLLGSEKFYPRFGYIPASRMGILPPFDVPAENFMAIRLQENAGPVSGILKYAEEFGI